MDSLVLSEHNLLAAHDVEAAGKFDGVDTHVEIHIEHHAVGAYDHNASLCRGGYDKRVVDYAYLHSIGRDPLDFGADEAVYIVDPVVDEFKIFRLTSISIVEYDHGFATFDLTAELIVAADRVKLHRHSGPCASGIVYTGSFVPCPDHHIAPAGFRIVKVCSVDFCFYRINGLVRYIAGTFDSSLVTVCSVISAVDKIPAVLACLVIAGIAEDYLCRRRNLGCAGVSPFVDVVAEVSETLAGP